MRHRPVEEDALVAEFLITDIAAEHPMLLGPPTNAERLQLPETENTEPKPAAI